MSEEKKWVGYADLLEAKRRREEREAQEAQSPATETEKATADTSSPRTPLHVVENQADAISTPVDTPVTTPVTTPAVTPVDTPVTEETPLAEPTPVAPPVTSAARAAGEESPNQPLYLDATHTASEQRIYSVMYRETISRGIRERHFGPSEICRKTGIRSDRTVRTALHGLAEKLSIQVVSNVNGNPLGPRYRVFEPKEILRRRRTAGIEIDPQSKRIINRSDATPVTTPATTPATTGVNAPADTGVSTGDKTYRGTPAETTPVTPVTSTGVSKYRENEDYQTGSDTALSSSKSTDGADDDHAFLESLREIYERATGNSWTTADAVTAQRSRDIPVEVWGIAICYCVDRAPGHKFDRLAYVVEEARRHHEDMSGFTKEDLRIIMRHSLRQIERARQTDSWEPTGQAAEEHSNRDHGDE